MSSPAALAALAEIKLHPAPAEATPPLAASAAAASGDAVAVRLPPMGAGGTASKDKARDESSSNSNLARDGQRKRRGLDGSFTSVAEGGVGRAGAVLTGRELAEGLAPESRALKNCSDGGGGGDSGVRCVGARCIGALFSALPTLRPNLFACLVSPFRVRRAVDDVCVYRAPGLITRNKRRSLGPTRQQLG